MSIPSTPCAASDVPEDVGLQWEGTLQGVRVPFVQGNLTRCSASPASFACQCRKSHFYLLDFTAFQLSFMLCLWQPVFSYPGLCFLIFLELVLFFFLHLSFPAISGSVTIFLGRLAHVVCIKRVFHTSVCIYGPPNSYCENPTPLPAQCQVKWCHLHISILHLLYFLFLRHLSRTDILITTG